MPKRPTLIVAEPEPNEALSVRKLVLETGKFNVLTAHSTRETIDIFQSFPNVSAVIAVDDESIDCEQIITTVKEVLPNISCISLSARIGYKCTGSDYQLSSHEPERLLNTVRELFGDPRKLSTS